ncbi:MAG TPA: sodium:proton antiporter [Casimicrobiaceae bacterium]|nr:sodium:proton antiporter [Casimicrobiaceae bacterium]
MTLFELFGLVLTLIAVLAYLNHRLVKLPETIGITTLALVMSMGITGYGLLEPQGAQWAHHALASVNFSEVVLHGILGLLLFAGSMTLELSSMARQKGTIFVLATVGVVVSTLVVGYGFYFVAQAVGYPLPLMDCMLLGAVVSPTDPVAVIGVLRRAGMSREMEMQIAGESLFNDGTGVVAVITVLAIIAGGQGASAGEVATLLARQAIGGAALGLVLGAVGMFLLRGAGASHAISILITLALATGGYALGEHLKVSALIAVIVTGLMVGNYGRRYAMTKSTQAHVFEFWEIADQLLNLVLFGLIGIQVIALQPTWFQFFVCALAVPVGLAARWLSVAGPLAIMARFRRYDDHTVAILTWGGLRGGLSVALALSLPAIDSWAMVVGATYAIVIFSILVQALTLGRFVAHLRGRSEARRAPDGATPQPGSCD